MYGEMRWILPKKPQLLNELRIYEPNMPVIETHNLAKTLEVVEALITCLTCWWQQNTICGFLGPNGAGKPLTI